MNQLKVYDSRILGLIIGVLFGGALNPLIDTVMALIGFIGVIEIFMKNQQILTGALGGFLIGLSSGYFLRETSIIS